MVVRPPSSSSSMDDVIVYLMFILNSGGVTPRYCILCLRQLKERKRFISLTMTYYFKLYSLM